MRKKYTSRPRYWNVPVLVYTGTFLVYQYCLKMWYLRSSERAGVIQKLTKLGRKNGVVLSNTRVPVSGTWSIHFPMQYYKINGSKWMVVKTSDVEKSLMIKTHIRSASWRLRASIVIVVPSSNNDDDACIVEAINCIVLHLWKTTGKR